jgi:predicted outer membrane protein
MAQIPDVASYGRQMAADHASALETLRLIAQARQSEIPRSPDAEQMESYYQLSHIGGDDFHRQFMDGALWHQRSELATLEREAVSGRDSRLVAFARERQPVVAGAERLAVDVEVRNHLNVPIVSGPGDMR